MKKIILTSVMVISIVFPPAAEARDACGSILCLAGKLAGQSGGSSCSGYLSDYFSIIEYGKKWRFNPGRTASSRMSFLNSCSSPGNEALKSQINAAYGMLQFMP